MKGDQADKTRLLHIQDAIQEIKSYKQIEIIGEAANNISKKTKELYYNINWRRIIALRNILVHEYFGIDENIIWTIITKDLIAFEKQIDHILKDLSD
jgi:uncharacterized protein with HEPN domain